MKNNTKPKLLIITGPQGSGNHLFAKIFSLHLDVIGWNMEPNEWQGHHQEPFSKYWDQPELLSEVDWSKPYYVTSVSSPYVKNRRNIFPDYVRYIEEAKKYCEVIVAIIGRDRNILNVQQERLRGGRTTQYALQSFKGIHDICDHVHYLSQELFTLYGIRYLQNLEKTLGFPIAWRRYSDIIELQSANANKKYIQKINKGDYDEEVIRACEES